MLAVLISLSICKVFLSLKYLDLLLVDITSGVAITVITLGAAPIGYRRINISFA